MLIAQPFNGFFGFHVERIGSFPDILFDRFFFCHQFISTDHLRLKGIFREGICLAQRFHISRDFALGIRGISIYKRPVHFLMLKDILQFCRLSGFGIYQCSISLQTKQFRGRDICIDFRKFCCKLFGDKCSIVIIQKLSAITLINGIYDLRQFSGNFIQSGFFCLECIIIFPKKCSLHQIKGNDMAYPAVLYFFFLIAFLFDDHIRVDLLCGRKTLCLDNFKISGNYIPLVIQQLIRLILVDQGKRCNTAKDILRNSILSLGDIQIHHFSDQFAVQICIKICER